MKTFMYVYRFFITFHRNHYSDSWPSHAVTVPRILFVGSPFTTFQKARKTQLAMMKTKSFIVGLILIGSADAGRWFRGHRAGDDDSSVRSRRLKMDMMSFAPTATPSQGAQIAPPTDTPVVAPVTGAPVTGAPVTVVPVTTLPSSVPFGFALSAAPVTAVPSVSGASQLPSQLPSGSSAPSNEPSFIAFTGNSPTISSAPSDEPSLTGNSPTISSGPSHEPSFIGSYPTISSEPSDEPSQKVSDFPSSSSSPSSMPSFSPSA
jgi:hypothetical protein